MGRGAAAPAVRDEARRKRSEQQVQTPLQGGCTPIANLTERAKRSETVGSSPTVTTRAEAVENQRLLLLCLHPGVHCPGVVFVGVNGSDNPNCQNCRLAQLPELSGWLHWWKLAYTEKNGAMCSVKTLKLNTQGWIIDYCLIFFNESTSTGMVASKSTPYQGFSGFFNVSAIVRAV